MGISCPRRRTTGGAPTFRCRSEASCWSIERRISRRSMISVDLYLEQRLSVLHRCPVLRQDLPDRPADLGLELVHELHGLQNAKRLADADGVPHLDEGRRFRRWSAVKRPHHGGFHDMMLRPLVLRAFDPGPTGRDGMDFGCMNGARWRGGSRCGALAALHDPDGASPAPDLELVDVAFFDESDQRLELLGVH